MSDLPPVSAVGAPTKQPRGGFLGGAGKPAAAPKAAPKAKAPRAKVSASQGELKKAASSAVAWISAGVELISPQDAAILEVRSERIAARLAEVAQTNDALARLLLMAGTGSGWAGLATELAAVSVAIAANHGKVSPAVAAILMKEYPETIAQAQKQMQADADEVARRRNARQVSL